MKIYFTSSSNSFDKLQDSKKQIITIIKKSKHRLLSGEQTVHEYLLQQDKKLTPKEIFTREKKLIDDCDCMIAEVSNPSLGVGSEIAYALVSKKPVLALVFKDFEDSISPMIKGNPSDNLYLEFYSLDNLKYKINDFLSYLQNANKRKGKLIVIDGGDGSGKTTQAKLLIEYLKKKSPVKYMDFPQYYQSFHGKTVARFLRGEFGSLDSVSPYLASLAYALDRASVKNEMEEFLQNGGYIVSNRYATSSMAHQGAKMQDKKKQNDLVKWIFDLEYKQHKIPKEDLVIYLYMPSVFAQKLASEAHDRKKYLRGGKDISENINHALQAEKMFLSFAKQYKHWVKIDCVKNNKLLSIDEVHKQVIEVVQKKFNP